MAIGELDDVPDIEAELIADQRQLVSESDVDVARGVLDELDQFRRRRIGAEHLALQEHAVNRLGVLGAGFGHPANDTIVFDQFADHPPGKHSLRTMRHMDIQGLGVSRRWKAQVGTQPRQTLPEMSTGAIASAAKSM